MGHTDVASSVESLPPILFVDFNDLLKLNELPRCGDPAKEKNKNIGVDMLTIDRDNALIIFVSHCWMRGREDPPHPDNPDHHKFELCKEGIQKFWRGSAPGMQQCYVWIDFCCINQDGDPAGELKQLDKIVEFCDCIFTPIVDEDWDKWELVNTFGRMFVDYKARRWNHGDGAYLNRCWCRVEMLYAAVIPLLKENASTTRIELFTSGLKFALENDRRLHVLYGDREVHESLPPVSVPPLLYSHFEKYSPLAPSAFVSVERDRIKIGHLIEDIQKHIKPWTSGYEGDHNSQGEMHGRGVFYYFDGDKYDGEFKKNKKHGKGVYFYADGAKYDGEWENDKKVGRGVYYFADDGNKYDGGWQDSKMHGRGVLYYANGAKYDGEWEDDKKHGRGVYYYTNGDKYDGEYRHGNYDGRGVLYYANGSKYDGEYKDDKKHGSGVFYSANGDAYDVEYKDGEEMRRSSHRSCCCIS